MAQTMDALVVPGRLESLEQVGAYTLAAAEAAGLDARASYRLRLAVDELATNAIVHGYQEAGLTGDLTLRAEVDDGALRLTLEDSGARFDPREQTPPEHVNRAIEERPIGGLGIFLVLRSVDGLEHAYVEGRNRYTITMKRAVG